MSEIAEVVAKLDRALARLNVLEVQSAAALGWRSLALVLCVASAWGAWRHWSRGSWPPRTAVSHAASSAMVLLMLVSRPESMPSLLAAGFGVVLFGYAEFTLRRAATSSRAWPRSLLVLAFLVASPIGLAWSRIAPERLQLRQEMQGRKHDPWPQGATVPLGSAFGVEPARRGWLSHGGGFSPGLGSFGIAFWVVNERGERLSSSDELPRGRVHHRLAIGSDGIAETVVTTPQYVISYRPRTAASWHIEVRSELEPASRLRLVVRSAGPAGGPLRSIAVDQSALWINDRWRVRVPEGATVVALGDEQVVPLSMSEPVKTRRVESRRGWAFAQVELPVGSSSLEVLDERGSREELKAFPRPAGCSLSGFPDRFVEQMDKHQAMLLTSVVGSEVRPGNPASYPLAWQRDGAYVLAGFARCGYLELAKDLSRKFAADDFFGGFGSEADAPGLGLWAIGEVARLADSASFDWTVWPHVQRKARIIEAMLTAQGELRMPFSGVVAPQHARNPNIDLLSRPSARGLIEGRMDWHVPVYYVSATGYHGLVEAAEIAQRLGMVDDARRWSEVALRLQAAYRQSMKSAAQADVEVMNERTTINALYPTDIAEPEAIETILTRQWSWERAHDGSFKQRPLWTYFNVAQAHQWLRLGRADRAWQTIDWFEENDLVPGLGVFWEGEGDSNAFGVWNRVRGNQTSVGVAPHYWTSAEVVLLFCEMLAYGDRSSGTVVVGGGIPEMWLGRPLVVEGIGTSLGRVSWYWNGREVTVDGPSAVASFELGSSFPPGTSVRRIEEAAEALPPAGAAP